MVDQVVVKQEMDYLTQFVAIVCFVGGAASMVMIPQWIRQVQDELHSPINFW
jgi:hypothetical protein